MEEIIEQLEYAIEQHPSFLKVLTPEEIEEQEKLNKQREWYFLIQLSKFLFVLF